MSSGPRAHRPHCDRCKETFGPVVAVYNALSDEPDRIAAVDRTFVEFVTSADEGTPGGPAALRCEYLLVVASTPGA
jgi:hypothetical protein